MKGRAYKPEPQIDLERELKSSSDSEPVAQRRPRQLRREAWWANMRLFACGAPFRGL